MRRALPLFCLITSLLWVGLPTTAQGCAETTGRTERQSYRSTIAQTTMYYTVYLPPCYDETTTYPVLYLMHGSASFDDHWLQAGLDDALDTAITAGKAPPMIAVLPFGEWIANQNQFERVSFGNVFIEELMPTVEGTYPVATDRERRAIGGISRGGFWAFGIAFRNPDLFTAVGGHSAFFDRFHAPPDHNPLDLALNAPEIESLAIWLDRGANDFAAPGLDLMDANLTERGLDHTYTVHPEGEHDLRYWSAHVDDYVKFYAAALAPTPTNPAVFAFTPPRQVPTPDTSTFAFTPPRTEENTAYDVFVPVVAFNSTRAKLDSGTFLNLIAGISNPKFLLDDETAARLAPYGVNTAPARTLPRAELERALFNDRNAFALLPFDALTPRYRVLLIDEQNPLFDASSYALAFRDTNTPNFEPSRLTTLTLSGVTAITRSSTPVIDRYGVDWAASGIAEYTNRVDYFHTSNEVSFTSACPQSEETPLGAFCSKLDHFPILEQVGLDIVELSGNHNNDHGYTAYLDTLQLYREAGIQTVGGGATIAEAKQPLILVHNGNTIAMLACNNVGPFYAIVGDDRPGAAACGPWMQDTLTDLQPFTDLIIITVQHLEFEEYLPRPEIQFDFRQLADWGADIVAGTHAHKPQSFEFYANTRGTTSFLHYGLGNLFFDQPFWGNSRFWMDTLFIYDGQLATIELFTGIIEEQARPRPMTPEERQNWLDFMFVVNNGVQ